MLVCNLFPVGDAWLWITPTRTGTGAGSGSSLPAADRWPTNARRRKMARKSEEGKATQRLSLHRIASLPRLAADTSARAWLPVNS